MHIPDQRLIRALMDARLRDAQPSTPGRSGRIQSRVWVRIRDWWNSVVDRATRRPPPGIPSGDLLSHGSGH